MTKLVASFSASTHSSPRIPQSSVLFKFFRLTSACWLLRAFTVNVFPRCTVCAHDKRKLVAEHGIASLRSSFYFEWLEKMAEVKMKYWGRKTSQMLNLLVICLCIYIGRNKISVFCCCLMSRGD